MSYLWRLWQTVERGEDADSYKNRHDKPIWEMLKREFDHTPHPCARIKFEVYAPRLGDFKLEL